MKNVSVYNEMTSTYKKQKPKILIFRELGGEKYENVKFRANIFLNVRKRVNIFVARTIIVYA